MEFSRQEYWSGLPFPSPRDLPDPGIENGSLALQADFLKSELPGKPQHKIKKFKKKLKYVLYIIANKLQPHFWRGGGDWMHEGCSWVGVMFYFLIWMV